LAERVGAHKPLDRLYWTHCDVTRESTQQQPAAMEPQQCDAVLAQLECILATPLFQHSKRYPAFLRYIVEQTVRGARDDLKERTLGVAVFKRQPDYDTSADPVVRNTASEVRKRLEEYYSGPAHEHELRISLPSGTYVPEFRSTAEAPTPLPEKSPDVRTRGRRLRSPKTVIAVCLLAAVAIAAITLLPRKSAIKRFWEPILATSDPVLVVADTRFAFREPHNGSEQNLGAATEMIDPQVFLDLSEQSSKLGAFLGARGKRIRQQLARDTPLANLRTQPFILRGAFNNQWTQRAVAPFRFYLAFDRDNAVRRIVDRLHPERKDWAAPMRSPLTEDYALIARAPYPDTGQMMLVVAGLGEKGSAAAMEFVTNPQYLERFSSQAPPGWERRSVELIIKTNLVRDDWGEPRLVATHVW
jgi:hypothetical protein